MKYHCIILLFATLFLVACNTRNRIWVGPENQQKIFNHKYGEHKKHVMDIFLPANYHAETPVVVLVHGGFWKFGNKEHMIMIQKYLFENQVPTININYRPVSSKKKITYQQQLQDIESALAEFNKIAERAKLSPDNYTLLGESAGAHLSMMYGYQHPEKIKKIISLSGPTDLYTAQFLKTLYSRYASPTIEDVVGVKFKRKALSDEFRAASPIAHISNVPTLIFQGGNDLLVNRQQGFILDSVLTAKKIPHKFIYMENSGHTPRFFSKKKRDSLILPEIVDWVKK